MLHKMLLEEMITCYSLDLEIKTAYGKELKNVWKFETDLPGNSIANIINVSYITLKISKEFRNYAEEEKNLVRQISCSDMLDDSCFYSKRENILVKQYKEISGDDVQLKIDTVTCGVKMKVIFLMPKCCSNVL